MHLRVCWLTATTGGVLRLGRGDVMKAGCSEGSGTPTETCLPRGSLHLSGQDGRRTGVDQMSLPSLEERLLRLLSLPTVPRLDAIFFIQPLNSRNTCVDL